MVLMATKAEGKDNSTGAIETVRQKTYNDIHGYYRAWVDHCLPAFGLGGLCVTFG